MAYSQALRLSIGLCYEEWGWLGGWEAWLERKGRGLRVQSQKGAWLHIKEVLPVPKALLMPTGLCNGEGGLWGLGGVAYTSGRGLCRKGRGFVLREVWPIPKHFRCP